MKAISVVLCALVACNSYAQSITDKNEELSISLELRNKTDNVATIDIENSIQVVLKNISQHDITLWHPRTLEGYDRLTLEWGNEENGRSLSTRRVKIDNPNRFKNRQSGNASRLQPTILIKPGATLDLDVDLLREYDGKLEWQNIPDPNRGIELTLRAQYAITERFDPVNWSGIIQSDSIRVKLVSPRLKNPIQLLRKKLAGAAIRLMKSEPTWINRKIGNSDETPLHIAVANTQLDAVKWLLENGADVNARSVGNSTPLHFASDPEVVAALLKHGADLRFVDSSGQTPLQQSASAYSFQENQKWKQIVEQYLAAGVYYDIQTAIHLDDLRRVKQICENQPDKADELEYQSPLRTAASLGRFQICKFLIEDMRVDVDQFESGNGYPVIKDAIKFPTVLKLLIENGADLQTRITWQNGWVGSKNIGDDATVMHFAAYDGVSETISLLLDAGVDPLAVTDMDQTSLRIAAMYGRADTARAMIAHPSFIKMDAQSRQALLDESLIAGVDYGEMHRQANRLELVRLLLEVGANPNALNNKQLTAMQVATHCAFTSSFLDSEERMQILKWLVKSGGKVDLISAVAIGDEDAVKRAILQSPDSIHSLTHKGFSALHIAAKLNYPSIVRLLLLSGVPVDLRNQIESTGKYDRTALHNVACQGNEEVAKVLIEFGADVNAKSADGSTPLHDSASCGTVSVAKILLHNEARLDAKNHQEFTPVDLRRRVVRSIPDEILILFNEHSKQ